MRTKQHVLDDGFQGYLTEGANFEGEAGIPILMDINQDIIPKDMVPFSKAKRCQNKRQYIHFYEFDEVFSKVLTSTRNYVELFKQFDGVITPDCSMLIGQSKCLQETNTYMNRAVGFYLQRQGINVIPNIRWSDELSFDFCFLGVPKGKTVCVSTHGCCASREQKDYFKTGLRAMLKALEPKNVLVHGSMSPYIFDEFKDQTNFIRYASQIERVHNR